MTLDQIVVRLQAEASPPLRMVGKAGDIPVAQDQARGAVQSPSAYVVPIGDTAEPNRLATGAHDQRITDTFGVLLVVRDLSDAKGGAAAQTFSAIKSAVRDALVAWTPSPADTPVELVDGKTIEMINGELWWLERYRSQFHLRKT
jgi:hypothetical protein